MRAIAAFFTLLMLAAAGLAGAELRTALVTVAPLATPDDRAGTGAARAAPDPVPVAEIRWPALFGEPQPPAPPAPPPPAPVAVVEDPEPAAPPHPPLASLGYELKGLVRSGEVMWGLVSHPTGERIMRAGDQLDDDLVIVRIDEAGLWVGRDGEAPELLGFAE